MPDTLAYLRRRHRLVLFTKGNHDEQWDKVVRSGLRDLFHQVDVVREKDADAYADAARRLGVRPESAWMIGNSPKSDILPARAAGFGAVFVPHPGTWVLELDDLPEVHDAAHPAGRGVRGAPGDLLTRTVGTPRRGVRHDQARARRTARRAVPTPPMAMVVPG